MFRKASPDAQSPARHTPPGLDRVASGTFSILGADVAIVGDISATVDLHIDGRVEGDVSCATLDQGAASEILGAVRAEEARLAGKLRGSITAGTLVILKTARIEGDVHYHQLTVEAGALVDGRFTQRASAEVTPLNSARGREIAGEGLAGQAAED